MFDNPDEFGYQYAPILSISPAEMVALEELTDKAKDMILPIIPLKGWVGSQKLENSIPRIEKAIGQRFWIADIDASFLTDNKEKRITGKYPSREVFKEIEALLSPKNGYDNWFKYLRQDECARAIPVIQLGDRAQLKEQVQKLSSLDRGIVVRFTLEHIDSAFFLEVLEVISEQNIDNVFVVFDYGQVTREILSFVAFVSSIVKRANVVLPAAVIAVSCSSFPSSFSRENVGENPIYERLLFNKVLETIPKVRMIYSDRAGARADKIGGGGGIPSPRIDYPLANDWRFIREEFDNSGSPEEGEKEELYTLAAEKIMNSDYWNPNLRVWGVQVIEFTSKGEMLGVNSAMRATAVRINIHMHQQLYYGAPEDVLLDTDEDWEDD